MNAGYLDLMTGHPWEFIEQVYELELQQDLVFTNGVGLSLNNKRVVMATPPAQAGHFVGAVLTVENSSIGMDGTHAVVRDDGTPGGVGQIWLETDTGVVLATDPGSTWTFRWDEYPLPGDCETVNGIMSRVDDYGEIPIIDRTSERAMMLNDDDEAGTPEVALLSQPQRAERAPRVVMAAAEVAGASTLSKGLHRYLYCYYKNGRLSGRSNIAEVTMDHVIGQHVTLSNLEDWTAAPDTEPTERWLYREDPEAPGVFRRIAVISSSGTTTSTFTDTGLAADDDYPFVEEGPYRYLRFWPRSTDGKVVEVQYHPRATRLLHDLDVPAFPESYHELLVHLVCEELAARNNDKALSGFHEKRKLGYLARMRRRFLTQAGRRFIRRGRSDNFALDRLRLTVKSIT